MFLSVVAQYAGESNVPYLKHEDENDFYKDINPILMSSNEEYLKVLLIFSRHQPKI